jgi:hypothetical protein
MLPNWSTAQICVGVADSAGPLVPATLPGVTRVSKTICTESA